LKRAKESLAFLFAGHGKAHPTHAKSALGRLTTRFRRDQITDLCVLVHAAWTPMGFAVSQAPSVTQLGIRDRV
jgi:hypothetical protein